MKTGPFPIKTRVKITANNISGAGKVGFISEYLGNDYGPRQNVRAYMVDTGNMFSYLVYEDELELFNRKLIAIA